MTSIPFPGTTAAEAPAPTPSERAVVPRGDRALRAVAETMRDMFRVTDRGARLGGDAFMLLAPNRDEAAAVTLAERIRTPAAETQSQRSFLVASVSLGVVTFDSGQDSDADATALMRAADEALYGAKRRGGGNRVTAPSCRRARWRPG